MGGYSLRDTRNSYQEDTAVREKTRSHRMLIYAVAVAAMLGMGIIYAQPDSTPGRHRPNVDELKTLLEVKPAHIPHPSDMNILNYIPY